LRTFTQAHFWSRYDIGQALIFSRPPAIVPFSFDVKPHETPDYNPDNNCASFVAPLSHSFGLNLTFVVCFCRSLVHAWKFRFATTLLSVAHQRGYSAIPPTYATVDDLSRQLEQYPPWQPPFSPGIPPRHQPQFANWMMQQHFSRVTKQEVMLYLHRPFFAKGGMRLVVLPPFSC
jgi:hypothetical protein